MLQPMRRQIAISPIADPERVGSILIVDTAKGRFDQGIVIAKGVDAKYELEIGDHVCFSGAAGQIIHLADSKIIVLDERYIYGVFKGHELEIDGLFHVDKEGKYFKATMSSAIEFVRDQLERDKIVMHAEAMKGSMAKAQAYMANQERDRYEWEDDE